MKQTLLKGLTLLLILTLMGTLNAQNSQFKNAIGVKGILVDYSSPITNKYFSGNQTTGAVEYHYARYLNKSFNLALPARFGYAKYPREDESLKNRQYFGSTDLTLVYKLANDYIIKETAIFAPYIVAGVGVEYLDDESPEDIDAQIPLGLGLNIRLAPAVYLNAQTEYRLGLIKGNNSIEHGIGLSFLFGKGGAAPKDEEPPVKEETPAPADRDGDGVLDINDECPDVVGLSKFSGCPDTDGDGLADAKDKCPTEKGPLANSGCPWGDSDSDGVLDNIDGCPSEKGPAENKGCPWGDADGDGVMDNVDKCPSEKGPASNNGCKVEAPVEKDTDNDGVLDKADACPTTPGLAKFAGCPDSDGDGVKDSDDRCPSVAGTLSNKGCPEIKQEEKAVLDLAMRSVQFETGSNVIKTSSYSVLDQVADIMQKYPNYSLSISGYTDSVGDAGNNQRLSERRSKACFDYITRKGVSSSRMSYAGYGEESPIASNDTREGRAMNRRVEFRIFIR